MGSAVLDMPIAGKVSSQIDLSVRKFSSRAIVEDAEEIYQGFKATNDVVRDNMSDWHEFLKLLEQKPENYVSMCRDGDVERTIAGLEEAGKTVRGESWIALGKLLKEHHAKMYKKFKVVDENIEAFGALLQEVSWNLLILHRENQASTGKSFAIDEAIADLWSEDVDGSFSTGGKKNPVSR